MAKPNHKLFVYGSLLPSLNNPMSRLVQTNGLFVGKGFFYGKLYHISGNPGAILHPVADGHQVFGEIYELRSFDQVIAELDEYEEVGDHHPDPHEYIRREITVHTDQGEVSCWCYLYNQPVEQHYWITSGRYEDYILDGVKNR